MAPPPTPVQPDWRNGIAAIIASGPSLETMDLRPLSQCYTVAINTSYRYWPHADVLFTGGWQFLDEHRDLSGYRGEVIVCADERAWAKGLVTDPRTIYVRRTRKNGLETSRSAVSGRYSSVCQAISYCAHKRVTRLLLVGLDLQPGEDGRRRAGQDVIDTDDALVRYDRMLSSLRAFAAPLRDRGIEVIVCSPRTRLTWWPTMTLEEAIWTH